MGALCCFLCPLHLAAPIIRLSSRLKFVLGLLNQKAGVLAWDRRDLRAEFPEEKKGTNEFYKSKVVVGSRKKGSIRRPCLGGISMENWGDPCAAVFDHLMHCLDFPWISVAFECNGSKLYSVRVNAVVLSSWLLHFQSSFLLMQPEIQ